MLDHLLVGNFIAIYTVKQDMVIGNRIYRNVIRQIPCFLVSNNYVSAREEALARKGKDRTLVSVEEITKEQKKLILKVFQ